MRTRGFTRAAAFMVCPTAAAIVLSFALVLFSQASDDAADEVVRPAVDSTPASTEAAGEGPAGEVSAPPAEVTGTDPEEAAGVDATEATGTGDTQAALSGAALPEPTPVPLLEVERGSRAILLRVDGAVSPASAEFILDGLARAEEKNAAALIIEINTPGGLLSSTRTIVQALLDAEVPTLSYVAPGGAGAASAGVFIVMAANVAAMAPGTNIGASTPVQGSGADIPGAMNEKVLSFTASFAKAVAEQRGRNVEWAEQAVREAVSATDREALEAGVVDMIAVDVEGLLAQADGRTVRVGDHREVLRTAGVEVQAIEMTFRQKVLSFLSDPNVAYLLMLAGLLGLYLELSSPGTMVPGLVGGLCLAVSLASFQILPIDSTGLVLLIAGLALLVTELFLPSFGIVGGVGVLAFLLGSLFLFDRSEPGLGVDLVLIGSAAATVGAIMLLMATLVVRAMRRRTVVGVETLLGAEGEVRTSIEHSGTVLVQGELWKAESSVPIEAGRRVRVLRVDGLTLQVEPLVEERMERE